MSETRQGERYVLDAHGRVFDRVANVWVDAPEAVRRLNALEARLREAEQKLADAERAYGRQDTYRELVAKNEALKAKAARLTDPKSDAFVGYCNIYADQGDPIFGALRQKRCITHTVLAPNGICPVGEARDALAAPEEAREA